MRGMEGKGMNLRRGWRRRGWVKWMTYRSNLDHLTTIVSVNDRVGNGILLWGFGNPLCRCCSPCRSRLRRMRRLLLWLWTRRGGWGGRIGDAFSWCLVRWMRSGWMEQKKLICPNGLMLGGIWEVMLCDFEVMLEISSIFIYLRWSSRSERKSWVSAYANLAFGSWMQSQRNTKWRRGGFTDLRRDFRSLSS